MLCFHKSVSGAITSLFIGSSAFLFPEPTILLGCSRYRELDPCHRREGSWALGTTRWLKRKSLPLRSLSFFLCKRQTSRDITLAQNFRLTEAAACAIYELVKCITYMMLHFCVLCKRGFVYSASYFIAMNCSNILKGFTPEA